MSSHDLGFCLTEQFCRKVGNFWSFLHTGCSFLTPVKLCVGFSLEGFLPYNNVDHLRSLMCSSMDRQVVYLAESYKWDPQTAPYIDVAASSLLIPTRSTWILNSNSTREIGSSGSSMWFHGAPKIVNLAVMTEKWQKWPLQDDHSPELGCPFGLL